MTARINARIDAELARKLEALRKRTGQTSTEIVRASLESYYAAVTRAENPAVLLADLIGCASGPVNLALDYKRALTKSLRRKHRP